MSELHELLAGLNRATNVIEVRRLRESARSMGLECLVDDRIAWFFEEGLTFLRRGK